MLFKHIDTRKEIKMKTYTCKTCKMKYPTKELAERCNKWCKENNSCNLEIIKHAIKEN